MRRRRPIRSPRPTAQPRFEVFVVDAFEGQDGPADAAPTRIGFAHATEDRKSFQIQLTALPVTGKLLVRFNANSEG